MTYKFLTYMLVVLVVAMLPALGGTGQHQVKHSGGHRLASGHDHASVPAVSKAQGAHNEDSSDANHHGDHDSCSSHSHSMAASFVEGYGNDLQVGLLGQELPEYRFSPISHFSFPDFRPPIV